MGKETYIDLIDFIRVKIFEASTEISRGDTNSGCFILGGVYETCRKFLIEEKAKNEDILNGRMD